MNDLTYTLSSCEITMLKQTICFKFLNKMWVTHLGVLRRFVPNDKFIAKDFGWAQKIMATDFLCLKYWLKWIGHEKKGVFWHITCLNLSEILLYAQRTLDFLKKALLFLIKSFHHLPFNFAFFLVINNKTSILYLNKKNGLLCDCEMDILISMKF